MSEPAAEPSNPLLAFILTILTPLLLTSSLTEATRAAHQMIAAYKAAGEDQLINIAQIAGFALTSLDNLRLSAAPDLSLSMKLKLRGNANALNRSSQRSTTTAAEPQLPKTAAPDDTAAEAEALAALEQARIAIKRPNPITPITPQPTYQSDQSRETIWANAMTEVAAESARNLAKLPPSQRRAEIIRIGALSEAASHLTRTSASNRSTLLTTTALGAL
ncbi:MAG: hypothetical protein JWQ55_1248 [Rhodopila sp.]|nr:hypothetical protein [Rhodopila sp.]